MISALFLGIPEAIMSFLMKKKSKFLKGLGFLIYICVYLVTVYVILVNKYYNLIENK